ncbi:MAG: hypothetical protein HUJ31_08565 [Pseudomonadales bacterium]|nr:hypothetical protein [Pseudomonadales bacterium]
MFVQSVGEICIIPNAYEAPSLLSEINGPRTDVEDITRLEYNDAGEVTEVINALGQTTQILTHDDNGHLFEEGRIVSSQEIFLSAVISRVTDRFSGKRGNVVGGIIDGLLRTGRAEASVKVVEPGNGECP